MFEKLVIKGGKALQGTVKLRGAKNFVSKAMVASILGDSKSILHNVPRIKDVEIVSKLLILHGCEVTYNSKAGILELDPENILSPRIADVDTLVGASRIPILFCGPLLHKLGEAFIPNLGGCKIGDRPIDFHLESLRQFGAVITKQTNGIKITAPDGLKGTKIHMPYPSVGATEQTLLTACIADGVTEVSNAAIEPEIMDLINVLQKMGSIISVATDRVITIEGVKNLKGFTHTALPDRAEAASWANAALVTKGKINVQGAKQQDMITFLNIFRKIGGEFDINDSGITFYCTGDKLKAIPLETDVHPGFLTDWMQPLVVSLTQAQGLSIIHETVYENRFGFTQALAKMGAKIQLYTECLGTVPCRFKQMNYKHSAAIFGSTKLMGADIKVPDLRAGFSYLIAALAAQGQSTVDGIDIIERGYEFFIDKLQALGADIDLIKN
ncbi:MAG: UDP-N-acetylglucosamine 1-carboxyvinyltransferase [Bifidobacteriaceae bacterium]|jgi:UDP-N-acetylglucosamine 1-carboxyvinyltransferase|nr:UDP-N-acetylglucosamine 1-carboxyvinyltransferase [Bifidobacteriaceae bacterium]